MKNDQRNAPKLRFPTFSEPWKQCKLGELTERVQGNDGRMNLPTLTVSAGNGWMAQEDRFNRNMAGSEQKRYTLLKQGELSYNHGNSKLAKYGVVFVLQTYKEALVPRVYHSFRMTNGNDAKFCEYVFETKRPDKELSKLISSGARMDGLLNINYEDFMGINVMIPSIKEQLLIRKLLESIDALITLQQRKLDQIKEYKKGMLQKMFPKDGETVPEVRFPGFDGEWEQHKFGEITEIKSASRVHRDEWTTAGVPFYRSSDVMSALNGTDNTKAYISEELYEKLTLVSGKLEQGDILVTGGGSVGNPYKVPNNEPLYTKDADLLWVKRNKRLNPDFVYQYFLSPVFRDYLSSISHVGTIAHYTIIQLENTPVTLPTLEEQTQIGQYLNNLDTLITLQQRKLEAMKEYKKGLLQQMFV